MSIETLATVQPTSGTSTSENFDNGSFDKAVMSTYGRYQLALERGAGCRVWDTQGRE